MDSVVRFGEVLFLLALSHTILIISVYFKLG